MMNSGVEEADWTRRRLEQSSSLLLIRLRSLGDSILTIPLIEALRRWRRNLQIDVLVETPFAPVFSAHPDVHETLSLRTRPGDHGWSRLRGLAEIRKRRYPIVINLHGGSTSLIYSLLSGAAVRIGQEAYRYPWAYDVRIPRSSAVWGTTGVHTVEHQLTLLRWTGLIQPGISTGSLFFSADSSDRIAQRLACNNIANFVLIHPTATLATKQWAAENFAHLADALHDRYHLPIIFTAAPQEQQVLLDVARYAKIRHYYWSDLPLEDLFALIGRCSLFVGNDSGPTHAAAMLHKPIVVVWGSSNWHAWHPWDCEYELIRSELPCMPCPGYTCRAFGQPRCIQEIRVDAVLQACVRTMSKQGV